MQNFLSSLDAATWVLPALVLWPLIGALLVRLVGSDAPAASGVSLVATGQRTVPRDGEVQSVERPVGLDARAVTLAVLAVEAVLGLVLWGIYDGEARGWQARVDVPWLTDLGATFSLGVDGISMPMAVMSALLMPLAFLGSWSNVRVRTRAFGVMALLLTSGILGIFLSLDLLLFYLSWELMLIPMYFLIGIWGTGDSRRASLRYVLFTLVGSLLMLVAIVLLWKQGGGTSFHIDALAAIPLTPRMQLLLFGAFFTAFAVKSALVPFHTWLPDAQSSAPTFVAVALGLKVGTYAILRFAIPLFPAAATHPTVRGTILVLSAIAIIYGALVAMSQRDFKRLVAYTSISHLGFIMLGCFALTQQSVQGAVLIMVNHGISTSALFLLGGMLEDRYGTTDLAAFGGLARTLPLFSVMLSLAMFSTIALPGTNGFVGEFLVLLGTYSERPALAIIATTGVIFAAIYGLRALQAVLFGREADVVDAAGESAGVSTSRTTLARDLNGRELAVMSVFALGILWLGVAPAPVLRRMERATRDVVQGARFGPNATPSTNLSVTTPTR